MTTFDTEFAFRNFSGNLSDKGEQFGVESLHGQPHNIVERPLDTLDSHIPYPLLNAVCTGLVVGAEVVDVVVNLLVAYLAEADLGLDREGA